MWSASSMTVTSTADSVQWPWPMRSSSRPGQATTMSTPRRRAATCGFWPTPPKTVRVVRPLASASGARASLDLADQLPRRGQDEGARGARAWPAAVGRAGPPAVAGRRTSCRSRCGRGRARRARRVSRAGSRSGWGWGCRCRAAVRTSDRRAGTPRLVKEDKEDRNLWVSRRKPGSDAREAAHGAQMARSRRAYNSRRELNELRRPTVPGFRGCAGVFFATPSSAGLAGRRDERHQTVGFIAG